MADRKVRLLVVALLTVLLPSAAQAQVLQAQPVPQLPQAPRPDTPGLPGVGLGAPQPAQPFPAPVSPPPMVGGVGVCPPPPCQPFLPPQPGMPGPGLVDGSFFVGLQFDILFPDVHNGLQGTFLLNNGTGITLTVPSQSLSWTVSPKLELGWHLPQGGGDVILSYRFFASEGNGFVSNGIDDFNVKSRLNVNIFDLDYFSYPEEIAPRWFARWGLGARVAAAYYDTEAIGAALATKASNDFLGVGPMGSLEIARQIELLPAFSVFARADASLLVGQITQKYYETVASDPTNPLSGSVRFERTQSVPTLSLIAGLRYDPPAVKELHFSIGYQWEQWWSLGREQDARLDLTTNSFFLRGQYDF
jgi:Legionella pneumophila major outer membrane protein precursor